MTKRRGKRGNRFQQRGGLLQPEYLGALQEILDGYGFGVEADEFLEDVVVTSLKALKEVLEKHGGAVMEKRLPITMRVRWLIGEEAKEANCPECGGVH